MSADFQGRGRHARGEIPRRFAVGVVAVAGITLGALAALSASGAGGVETASAPLQVSVQLHGSTASPSRSLERDGSSTEPQASMLVSPTPTTAGSVGTTTSPSGADTSTPGGGDTSNPAPNPVAPPPPPPPSNGSEQLVADIVAATNSQRVSNGLGTLTISTCATRQLDSRLAILVADGGFYHPEGFDAAREACGFLSAAENLALGQTTGTAVVDAWMASEGHRTNLLGDYTTMGVSCQMQGERWLCGTIYGR